ncbi:hypothetical protein BCV09_17960 [Vibrio cyclitrophicus]|uniref:hypothetical protein n=1 Tax=Vibrio TaxID=662 RepID=UPI00031AB0E8|nr:hypothetical protein [Vibrio cyclitrophicus]OEF42365.1 hypothetical protein OAE_15995 [Vibrio cyclitrophicus 1F289]PME92974.1 hypothetical protein BCV26_13185 [Vibrio cyclitrophicus]PMF14231.1 hypothetical protein BCV20_10870 [Vibrio cyclitrophicus]PMF58839.1 hypothetical protein BCV09_05800 [Vibrio cyclitrophicus]
MLIRIIALSTLSILSFSANSSEEQEKHPHSVVYAVNGIEYATKLGPKEIDTKSIRTGDHHCSSSCKGEPTRTPYRIDYRVDPKKYKIVGANLSCDAGSSCSYNAVKGTNFTSNTAYGSFDVWSRPSTWTLTVSRQPIIETDGDIKQIDSDRVRAGRSFVIVHDVKQYKDIELEFTMPFGQLAMSPSAPIERYFELLTVSDIGATKKYTLLYKGVK